jgi:hypothetical protein
LTLEDRRPLVDQALVVMSRTTRTFLDASATARTVNL